MWKDLGKRNVKLFDSEEEIRKKKEEEERRRRQEQNKSGLFSSLRSKLSGPSLGEAATQARKMLPRKVFGTNR